MKKLFMIIALAVIGITAKAQAVSDMAVIPIGVTLNSIMRLSVTSGGNIEFVVNTMEDYESGVGNTSAYTTTFSVASSVKFGVALYADSENMKGTINAENTLPVSFLHYKMHGGKIEFTTEEGDLDNNPANYIIGDVDSDNAQEGGFYDGIEIQWSLSNETSSGAKLLGSPSDRYVVNSYLQLKAAN